MSTTTPDYHWQEYMVMGSAIINGTRCIAQLSDCLPTMKAAQKFMADFNNPPSDICIWGRSDRGL